jgi:hypothetical protein
MKLTIAALITSALTFALFVTVPNARAADAATGPTTRRASTHPAAGDRAALEKWFAEMLTNATLTGSYTTGDGPNARRDSYTITKATKADGDNWVLTARIEYRGIGVPIDLTVPVLWAGDTPVIEVTNQKVPGFGTFTARVMFYADHYAGTWDAGDHGGLMWGRVEHRAVTQPGEGK